MKMFDKRYQQGQRDGQSQQIRRDDTQAGSSIVNEIKQKLEPLKSTGLKNLRADELVDLADKMGKYLKEQGLKTTQIRRFLDGIRKIDVQSNKGKAFNSELVILLRPKLAYAAREQAVKPLMEVLDPAITAGAESYDSFKKLIAFIEGIVAYHRFYGGKDS
jgi:CRISPR-associated protein Csm2